MLTALRKKILANEGAATATTPASLRAMAACSRDEPQPKLPARHDHRPREPPCKGGIEVFKGVRRPDRSVLRPQVAPGDDQVGVDVPAETDSAPGAPHRNSSGEVMAPTSAVAAAVMGEAR